MSEKQDLPSDVVAKLCEHAQSASRQLVAIAGPPGSGKSTLAENLCIDINKRLNSSPAVVLPMDGFHLDNKLLDAAQERSRKGAPHTFDVDGFWHMLQRVVASECDVIVPVFDRDLDLARAGGRRILNQHKLILVEGNYLLLDLPRWRDMRSIFAYTIYLDVPENVLQQRLTQRWLDHGMQLSGATKRAESNDLPNARLVASNRLKADLVVTQDQGTEVN